MGSAETALAPELGEALSLQHPDIGLRAESEADLDFVVALYTDTRWEELAPVDWPEPAKRAFLDQQGRLQHEHYLKHYAGAEMLLIVTDRAQTESADAQWHDPAAAARELIGRIYLRAGSTEIRLMDIALLPRFRGRGIGHCLIEALQAQGAARGIGITLHVEPTNPAQRLYQRLGFALIEQRGVYDFLGWSPLS
ncbi:MAG: GNAT family N-acetyltransferase [Pseudomonadota bacterium]|nr:GNAT family N-acetyltransferase [Pseudomonadota bacterium]